jgi:nucleoside-diphosphate-sugar epimerase
VTSSILAIQYETLLGRALDASFDETYRVRPLPAGPWKGQPLIPVYAAGKALALDIMDQLAASRPPFDVISILPAVVVGPNPLYKSADEMLAGGASNALMLRMAVGNRDTNPFPMGTVGLSDVARIHVAALDPAAVAGNDTFVLDARRPSYDEFKDIIAKHFPEAVKNGTFSMEGTWNSFPVKTDVSHTVKTFGPLDSYESDAVALAQQYLDLRAKESK